MKRYRYTGPLSGVTVGDREVLLHPGAVVELDPENAYTATMLALGHLTEEPEAAPVAPTRKRTSEVADAR